MSYRLIDITGLRFERAVAVKRVEDRLYKGGVRRYAQWLCRCDCGGEFVSDSISLRSGKTKSCGCYSRERTGDMSRSHGMSKTSREYESWCKAKGRCYNTTDHSYPCYGGRGIYMAEEWRNDFVAFLRDMGPKPSPEHSLDRIDNEGPYAPGNCRWATPATQRRNQRAHRLVLVGGVTLKDYAEANGVNYKRLHALVRYSGHTPEHGVSIIKSA